MQLGRWVLAVTVLGVGGAAMSLGGCVVDSGDRVSGFYDGCGSDLDCSSDTRCYTISVEDRYGSSSEDLCTARCDYDSDCPYGGYCQGADHGPALCAPN